MIYSKTHICYNKYALQKSLKERKRSSYFFDKSVKIEFGYKHKSPSEQAGRLMLQSEQGYPVCSSTAGNLAQFDAVEQQEEGQQIMRRKTISQLFGKVAPELRVIDGRNYRRQHNKRLITLDEKSTTGTYRYKPCTSTDEDWERAAGPAETRKKTLRKTSTRRG